MPNYTNIFEVFGMYARTFTQLKNLADRNLTFSSGSETFRSLDKLREEFVTVLNQGGDERDRLDAVNLLSDAARIVRGWSSQLGYSLDSFIRDLVAPELSVAGASQDEILAALARSMFADSQSIDDSAITIGAVSAGSQNVGDAACYVSKKIVDPGENEIDDERAISQTITIECRRDAVHDRLAEGAEEFNAQPEEGASVSLQVVPVTFGETLNARNVVSDGAFDLESGGVFTHWPIDSGGSVFSRDTGTKRFGTGALKLTGDGATAGDIRQDLVSRDPAIASGRLYGLGAWIYVGSLTAGQVLIDLLVDGSPSALTLTVDGSTQTGQWIHLGGLEYLPRSTYPNKVKLRIRCDAAFNGAVYIDGVSLAPATEVPHAGVQVILFQGATAPQARPIADRYTVASTNDDAGTFQAFFRDRLKIALPSSGSPTIADSLAE